ncbi:MAG TPA: MBL fold metallo-hydrolase [Anditalea sp.]|nr:MBL fold metallo-hydrolase [Anditalea sp.]
MDRVHIIDLHFQGAAHTIASFLIETDMGPVLIETGPESTFAQLVKGLATIGYRPEDIKHVFLSHIHFDHAGAAWRFAEKGAKIYVHPKGAKHLASPEKLWQSAKQIYGSDMEKLWGEMQPIDANLICEASDGELFTVGNITLTAWHTPGHASHHIAWQLDQLIFTGDVAGVTINEGPVVPPCPPPDINIEAWKASIQKIKNLHPDLLYLTHYGKVTDINTHFDQLNYILDDWAIWMKKPYDLKEDQQKVTPEFMAYTRGQLKSHGLADDQIALYEYANPSWMSVAGLFRYWKQKENGKLQS